MYLTQASAATLLLASSGLAIELDITSPDSIKSAAKTVASSVISTYHNGSEIIGLFGQPYYFWESGLAWDSLITYWYKTGDDTYNQLVGEALRWQLGDGNFMPPNQTKSEGNDDQSFWALAAMTAAEYSFPIAPYDGQNTTWTDIAANVFNEQVARWDNDTCGGGLRWQIFSFNAGYTYKNSLSNGNLFQLASRLGLYTQNTTYTDWAEEVLEWSINIGLIQKAFSGSEVTGPVNSQLAAVYDGTGTDTNCSQINHLEWTSNLGTFMSGNAYAYNAVSFSRPQEYLYSADKSNRPQMFSTPPP
jgi:mannan endo-1,6-alpha-mannosidase